MDNSSSGSFMVLSKLFLLVYTFLPIDQKFEEGTSEFAQLHFHSGLDFPLDRPHFILINLKLLWEVEDNLLAFVIAFLLRADILASPSLKYNSL